MDKEVAEEGTHRYCADSALTKGQEVSGRKIPGSVFCYSAMVIFFVGIIGMWVELTTSQSQFLFGLYFSLSFLLSPALLAYPIIRWFLGDGHTGLAALLSGLFGWYIQSAIKKKLNK